MGDKPRWASDSNEKRRINRKSAKQERDRAKEVGGRTQAGSGSSYRAPHDVKAEEHLEELKFRPRRYTVDAEEWERFRTASLAQGREPRLVIEFTGRHKRRLIIEEG